MKAKLSNLDVFVTFIIRTKKPNPGNLYLFISIEMGHTENHAFIHASHIHTSAAVKAKAANLDVL